jgi:hypothetical protein
VTTPARAVFAVLVAATFGAFFLAQRLKHSPTVIQQFKATPVFSPNRDGRADRAHINFKLKQADDVTITVVDAAGDDVRTLARDDHLPAYRPTRFSWDGRRDDGRMAPDGTYRARVTLRREGRAIVVPRVFRKDTVPPHPKVIAIGPQRDKVARPELLPRADGRPADVIFRAPGRRIRVLLFRTSPGRTVAAMAPVELPDGTRHWAWDGTLDGRPAAPGTYLAVVESRDRAGNIGTSVPLDRAGLPRVGYGATLPGRGGITVRRLAVQPPAVPVTAGKTADVLIDARQQHWTASLRRVGGPPEPIRRYSGTRARLRLTAPAGASGVYLLSVRTRGAQQRVPLLVQSAERSRVLVILPWMTWQGRNPVDDDGDGEPNLLDRGVSVRAVRVLAGDGLPAGFAGLEAPVLAFLDHSRHRYDVTTDLALAADPRPLASHRGVLLAGDTRWLTASLGRRLRAFVRGGGRLTSLGTGSLRRQVVLTRGGRLARPTAPAPTDLFGARLGALAGRPATLTNLQDDIGLFAGGTGTFTGVPSYEPTIAVGAQAKRVAAAVDSTGGTPGRPVIVAARFGNGLVIRTGLPGIGARLTPDRNTAALMGRIWTLLSR